MFKFLQMLLKINSQSKFYVLFTYFQMKLFREWSSKWPDQLRSKLIDKLNELDSDFGQKLNENLEARLEQNDEFRETEGIQNGMVELTLSTDKE